jgi:hypothetical protein
MLETAPVQVIPQVEPASTQLEPANVELGHEFQMPARPSHPKYKNLRPYTKEAAAIAGRKSAAILKQIKAAEAKRIAQLEQLAAKAKLQPSHEYLEQRIKNTRLTIERLEKLLMRAKNTQDLDKLASALSKLADLERVLDGRPLPGTRRPKADRASSRASMPVEPMELPE